MVHVEVRLSKERGFWPAEPVYRKERLLRFLASGECRLLAGSVNWGAQVRPRGNAPAPAPRVPTGS